MMTAAFLVPGKPTPKQRARKGKGGRWYTPKATADYERLVGLCGLRARATWTVDAGEPWPMGAAYEVQMRIVPATRRRLDVDNVAKSILDGLNRVLWSDDSQVVKLTVERAEPSRGPHVSVLVTTRPA